MKRFLTLIIPLAILLIFVGFDGDDNPSTYIESTSDEYRIAIQPQFARAHSFNEGLAAAAIHNTARNDNAAHFAMGSFLSCSNAPDVMNGNDGEYLFGFINTDGEWVIEPQFYWAYLFRHGVAVVQFNKDEYGLIDREGRIIVEPGRYEIISPFFTEEGFALVYDDRGAGLINTEGEEVVPERYDAIHAVWSEDFLLVSNDDKWGALNRDFELVIPIQYDRLSHFVGGIATVEVDGLVGVIDTSGQWIVPPQFENVRGFFSEGLAVAMHDEKWGFIDMTGNFVIPPQFDWVISGFSNGVALVREDGNYFMIDKEGGMVTSTRFNMIYDFYDGLALAVGGDNGDSGYIDITGELVLPMELYSWPHHFSEGFVVVGCPEHRSRRKGLIDRTGREIVPPRFRNLHNVSDGMAAFQYEEDGLWGYISLNP